MSYPILAEGFHDISDYLLDRRILSDNQWDYLYWDEATDSIIKVCEMENVEVVVGISGTFSYYVFKDIDEWRMHVW